MTEIIVKFYGLKLFNNLDPQKKRKLKADFFSRFACLLIIWQEIITTHLTCKMSISYPEWENTFYVLKDDGTWVP